MITNHKIGYNGRFGNQIFQYAALLGIANRLGYDFCVPRQNLQPQPLTTMDGKRHTARFELADCFDIPSERISDLSGITQVVTESHFHFDEKMMSIDDSASIDGYFQTDKYFSHCRKELLEELRFKSHISESARLALPSPEGKELVSIHVRRGDYTHPNQYHPLVGIGYIRSAMSYFQGEGYHFVVFSDDIAWCRSELKGDQFSFFDSGSSHVDFCAMSMCRHHIISNSSFSWWASYLSDSDDKIVVAPSRWFGPGFAHYNTDDLYRSDMVRADENQPTRIYNISILTICTGKYDMFFNDLYEACEKNLFPGHRKKYFVFTDGKIKDRPNVVKVHQDKLGWPYDTMLRFKMFDHIRQYIDGDFVFFLNANMMPLMTVGDEAIPDAGDDWLMGVEHPGYYGQEQHKLPYERREESSLHIPSDQGRRYYQGCFNGGRRDEFLTMSAVLAAKIDSDLSKGIVPVWHDESALNWYYSTRNPRTLDPSYAYPESVDLPFEKRMIQIDKSKHGGHKFLRS